MDNCSIRQDIRWRLNMIASIKITESVCAKYKTVK